MIQPHATIRLAPDEWVLYVTEPSLDMKAHWIRVTAGTIIGLLLFILPGIIILAVGIINGFSTRSNLQERYGSAQCVVTSKRLIATGWGQRRRLMEFEHHQIARMTSSGLLAKLLVGRSVTIHRVDGHRVKLDRLPDPDELVAAVQQALTSSRY